MPRVRITGWTSKCNEEALKLLCSVFGVVSRLIVQGGGAVVDFADKESATNAVKYLQNRQLIDGTILRLEMFYKIKNRVIIKNTIRKKELQQILAKYGKVYNIDEREGEWLVDFYDENDAASILKDQIINNGKELETRGCESKHASASQTIFIYNLYKSINEEEIRECFERFGKIISCGVNGTRGFVNYVSSRSAERAFMSLRNRRIKRKRLYLKLKSRIKQESAA